MISIIIPAWNEEKCLPKLLGCIKRQAYRHYEIIVTGPNSTDGTREIARKHGCRIVKGGNHPGISRNRGAKAAKGDILLFLDADSQVDGDFLKNAFDEMDKRNLDAAACNITPLSNNLFDKIFLGIFNAWSIMTQFFYPHAVGSGIFCKKWLHEKIKGFDETIKLAEDMDYVKRCSRHGKFRVLKSVKVQFSMRRYQNEGRLKVGSKILFGAIHRIFLGEIRSDVFKYNLRYRK